MDQAIVQMLEREIEEALAEVLLRLGRKRLPLVPLSGTIHLMAKAATTVYEAAVENQPEPDYE
jgi:hypothetical protein